jgi:glycosyltransferase involved in cell wall biosynthesis
MRIMEIISGRSINGAIIVCLATARALRARGHEVTVVCRPGAWIAEQLKHDDIHVEQCELRRWPPRDLQQVLGVIRERSIDVLHTHMSSAHFFGVLLKKLSGPPGGATAHTRLFQLHWAFNDYVIAVSDAVRRYHHRYNFVPNRRMEVVHNFVDIARFARVRREEGHAVRQELGIPADARLLTVVGDVIPRKGLLYVARALPELQRQFPNIHLLSLGTNKTEYGDQIRQELDTLGLAGHVTWGGLRRDVERVLAATDVFVLASVEEAMGIAILEAMSASLPVVATNVGGIPECVTHGETGLLVPPANPAALAESIQQLLADEALRARFGARGLEIVQQRFSQDAYTLRVEEILERFARKAPIRASA